ncbi:hypothetical protein BU23DRAFT_461664 [Bimuria novae-zelandiae CBS 107.79]|uniref:Rhodopsin domain-containing protein n=1 Tax=Bimuria novae-zelandiae CBS 107.79 TaxID=1447943 RepID=A0A6A5VLK6_9PLEO|nr:hypothetical protein BU23DRAFT_461664 [Bimuria novae-zelandiae CBS 107.79]
MPSNEEAAQVAGILLIVLDIITVAGRFYSRWFTKLGFGWDDWTILIALLAGIVPGALTIYGATVSATGPAAASNFNPDYVFTEADILYTKITFSTSVLYFFVASITKFSILLLLHRLFSISNTFKILIYVAGACVISFWLAGTLANVMNCIPLEWTWKNGNADPRYCINYNTFWLITGIFESLIDLFILALPIGIVFTLHLERNKRFGVAGIFLMGGFVLFSGVAKVILSYVPNSREPDFSKGALWTTVHLYTGILCANMPTARPMLNKIAQLTSTMGSKVRLLSSSSQGKRWYSLGSGQQSLPSHNGETSVLPQSTPGDNSRNWNRRDKPKGEAYPMFSLKSWHSTTEPEP